MFISFFETSHTLLHFIRTGDNFKHDQLSCYIDLLTTTLLVFYRSSSILNIFNVYKKKCIYINYRSIATGLINNNPILKQGYAYQTHICRYLLKKGVVFSTSKHF